MPATPGSDTTTGQHSATQRRRRHERRRELLSARDERMLARTIEAALAASQRIDEGTGCEGDEQLVAAGAEARRHFIEANVRLVQSIANRFTVPLSLDRDDLVQDGMIGLDKAVEKFDWRRGYKFSTYATWWIRQSIQRGLEASATTIRIPDHRARELRRATNTHGERLADDLAMIEMLTQLESIDRPLGDGHETLGSLLCSDDEGPDACAERNVRAQQTDALLDLLDPTSRYVVAARFGLRGLEPATFATIAEALGVTPQAVRRRVERSIAKLRTHATPIAA